MRYELTDHEWAAIKPMLPNRPRGVPRVNDRRVLNQNAPVHGPSPNGPSQKTITPSNSSTTPRSFRQ
jgi:hypothetical protein